MHSSALILSTGDELVMGQLQDTNARWLAERLTERGIRPTEFITVGDDLTSLVEALRRAASRAPLVVMSGGLGPTDGDLTREAICAFTNDTLIVDEKAKAELSDKLTRRGRPVSDRQLRQAHRPSRAACLPNAVGTAPGLWLTHNQTDIACLPGPPGELRPMWADSVVRRLRPDPARTVRTRLLYVIGLPEADAADRLRDATQRGHTTVLNLTAHGGILTIRIRFDGSDPKYEADAALETLASLVRQRLAGHIFAEADSGDDNSQTVLARTVLHALKLKSQTLATVESCTGGMLGEIITTIPGSSANYLGGAVTYSNALKTALVGVPANLLTAHGAVSRETAEAMARGGLDRTGAHHALAITGIAGPDGGTPEKPIGTVWIALATRSGPTDARRFIFAGDRHDVRARACTSALAMLWFTLSGAPAPRLLWQHAP